MTFMPATRIERPRAELVLLPVAPAAQTQRMLSVELRSPDGRCWKAIGGGGDTLTAAIEWARESCPHGATWEPVGWEDLYGEWKNQGPPPSPSCTTLSRERAGRYPGVMPSMGG
jgi:hypothetical protein